jgi:hypothetical protein
VSTRPENPTEPRYSEADVAAMRERWEQYERDRGFSAAIGRLEGQFATFPAAMEMVARKVSLEVLAEQGRQRWSRADQLFRWLQIAVAALVAYLALFGVSHPLIKLSP